MDNVIWLDRDGVPHVRNSERGTLNKCPQRWWWSWRDGLRPKETAKALWFGEGIHLALAHYYAPGRKRRKDFIDVWRQFAVDEAEYVRVNVGGIDEDVWMEASKLGEHMLQNYVKEYQHDRDWDVIATEQPFSVRIPVVPKGTEVVSELVQRVIDEYGDYFILNGTFDGVYRDLSDKKIKLMEHKTAASISVRHLPMDNQAGTYWMVAQTVLRNLGVLATRENIHAIMYNFLRKAMMDERPKDAQGYATNKPTKEQYIAALDDYVDWEVGPRGGIRYPTIERMAELADEVGVVVLGDRSKSQPPPLFERHPVRKTASMRKTQLARLQGEYVAMAAYVMGELPLTKSPSRDTCPMCPYSEMCELHESGANWIGFRDAVYRAEDPYADHRLDRKSA